ncbi:MAG: phospholipid carrier-dependent glycosyltransferase, partial [Chloroflexota bacterium]|nr:phospholipid carrier-dependent glycosyltransferase [Chloroflexota bacterium]
FTVIAAVIKPQLGILVPLVAVVTIRRALWPVEAAGGADRADDDGRPTGLPARLRALERRTDSPLRILTTGLAGYLTAVALCLPFGLSVIELSAQAPFVSSGLIDQIVVAGGGYPYLTVNAYNAWAVVPGDLGNSLANAGLWVCDAAQVPADRCSAGLAVFGVVPAVVVGAVLLVLTMGLALWVAARTPDRPTLLVSLSVLALAFFAVPTRVHERYGYPFFALGAILFAVSSRWRIAYVVLSLATFANMYVVLTTLYPDNPSISDWLGVGEAIRSQLGVTIVAILHTAAFVWAVLQLRADARQGLANQITAAASMPAAEPMPLATDDEPETTPAANSPAGPASPVTMTPAQAVFASALAIDTTGLEAPAVVAPPTWTERRPFSEAGFTGWFKDRLRERPVRADLSASLTHESGGRLDRLDLWFLIVIVLLTFGLRTFRLGEPAQMHFDEVYHARTATEFLQSWRYGIDHDIYEWTHPHLAKYAMAGGLVLWGEDDVRATSALGTPVRAAAVEPRRDDVVAGGRAGERVHVATGSEVRTYDLRSRSLISVIPAPGSSAVAVDGPGSQLVIGFEDGRIAAVDLAAIGLGGVDVGLQPTELTAVDHAVAHLLIADAGATIVAASNTTLTVIDSATGALSGTADLPGIADLAAAGTGASLVGVPAAIDEPEAVAATLAELLGGDAADYLARLEDAVDPEGQVVLGQPGGGDDRTAVEEAIGDGRLAGLEIVDLPRVAVATSDGVSFIDPATAGVSSAMGMDGGAHGMALVTGIDDTQLYVTSGPAEEPTYEVLAVGGDSAADGPVSKGRHPLPAAGTAIAYDDATQQVHILGRAPATEPASTEGWTVFVVEPHANAVYADARLPEGMVPAAWAMDVESQYVTQDRQELLVFGADGTTASIALGSHAFAWRLPGVIAGVLMAACLYLLTRILFRRRIVAVFVAALVALEGMLFVQSRIGMNDVYVGLFIIAAYTIFAAVWTGWWRGRGAFLISMPAIGVLLGLALASKWVAAYAIGALVLLLLVRSALGRVVAILGLIAITSVLGYMALSVPEGQGIGNVTFLVVMIALTLLAVV